MVLGLPHDEVVRAILAQAAPDQKTYLVGGAVRDLLLQRPGHDLDISVSNHAVALARRTANALGAAFFVMDNERDIARVVVDKAGERLFVDFAGFRGTTLQEDLQGRDFTLNAMALSLTRPDQLIDPLGGAGDLQQRILRLCSPTAIANDPARLLRAVRQAVAFDLKFAAETTAALKAAAPMLPRISGERQRDELFKLLGSRGAAVGLRILDRLGVLKFVLPEMEEMRGVQQSAPHTLDVFEHTLTTAAALENLWDVLVGPYNEHQSANLTYGLAVLKLGEYRTELTEHFHQILNPDRNLRSLLMFSALYHDTGKPACAKFDEKRGKVRFIGHPEVSAQLAEQRAHALALSSIEIERVKKLILQHMRIHFIARDHTSTLTLRTIYRYYKETGPAGVDLCLLSLADTLATHGAELPQPVWQAELNAAASLLEVWYRKANEVVQPPRLVSGGDVIRHFGLTPGPQVGELLEAVREAQAVGDVITRDDAMMFVGSRLKPTPGT